VSVDGTDNGPATAREVKAGGEKVAQSGSFEWLARAGVCRPRSDLRIIGILAIKLAVGADGKTTNQQGALETVARQPFGKGAADRGRDRPRGYALWRLLRALLGHGPRTRTRPSSAWLPSPAGSSTRGLLRLDPPSRSCSVRAPAAPATRRRRRRVFRLAGGDVAGGDRRRRADRRRALPGLPRDQQGLPQRLQDRGDEPRGQDVDRMDRAPSATLPAWSSSASSAAF